MKQLSGDWLTNPDTQRVLTLLEEAGHQAFAVGGCVRNALMQRPITDIDLATSAVPSDVDAIMRDAGMGVVPTGLDHGTLTIVASETTFEVTTFRADVETDGRHAVVSFTDDVAEDAKRRDFTMNALYVDKSGNLIDPLDGLTDVMNRRVKFIEDATTRIKEDYLRILRFFRFHAQYGDPFSGVDPEALAAIADNLDGLGFLAAERVGAEVRKLLSAPDPSPSLAAMQMTGVLPLVLPGSDQRWIAPLVHLERTAGIEPKYVRRLGLLGGGKRDDLRLTRKESKHLDLLVQEVFDTKGVLEIAWRHGVDFAWDALLMRQTIAEQPLPENIGASIESAAAQKCPISARDLLSQRQGASLGASLKAAEQAWIESGFRLNRPDLIAIALKEG